MYSRTTKIRVSAVAALTTVALFAAGCTTNPPPGGNTLVFEASHITNTSFTPNWPPTFWLPDPNAQNPYLVHLGLRIRVAPTVSITTSVSSTYLNSGATIGAIGANQTIPVGQGDGIVFNGISQPDTFDLINGSPFEIVGSVELLMERKQLIPLGIPQVLQGVSDLLNAALPPLIANGGLPSDPGAILDYLGQLLPSVLGTIGGVVAAAIGGLTGGDQLVGFNIPLFLAVGGGLGSFLGGALPGLTDLINFVLSLQDPNPFPGGLPFSLGVVGYNSTSSFGTAPASAYRVDYRWRSA